MAQSQRSGREQMRTQPFMMPGERYAPGEEPAGRDGARPVRRRSGQPSGGRDPSRRARGRERRRPPRARRPESAKQPRKRPGRKGRARGAPSGRRRPDFDVRRWRAFVVLVVVPVLLMLGSVYTHAAADGVSGKIAELQERREMAEVRQENLDLRLTELTAPGRIRSEARDMGLQDPVGSMQVYGSQGEDGTDAAGQTGEERGS